MWISDVSQTFPGATFRLLTGMRTARGAIELGEVISADPDEVSEAIRSHSAIRSHQQLDSAGDRSLSRYETTESDLYEFVEEASLAPEYPITVQDGWFEYDLTATRDEYEQFRQVLEESNLAYELVSIVQFFEAEGLLTDRQHQVLETAFREGYFEVPRECTLAELAEELGVDKSTVSEILRRADGRIIKQYLTGVSQK